jgi:DNA invertase Pin-like site-specific DNA recombinase
MLLDSYIEDMDMPSANVLEFVDNGFTGTDVERPAFQEMIELVRCGRVNCVIVKDFSRFARHALESGYYIEKVFPLYRVRFIAVGDNYDSNDHKNGAGIDVAFKFFMNEYYSKDLSRKIKSALRVLMQNGEHIVAGAIYGYRKNSSGKWEHDPPAAEVVREIFNMALDGKTTAQIRDKLFADRHLAPREYEYLNKGKAVTPKYNWATNQIWRILNNEQYTGTYIAGKQESSRIGSKSLVVKDRSEWIIIPDSHPAIVSKEEFERVQKILANPKAALPDKPAPTKVSRSCKPKIINGERKSCAVPYGYVRGDDCAWVVFETATSVVREIYEMALDGLTAKEISEKLYQTGYPTASEQRKINSGYDIQPTNRWLPQAVRDILSDEQYTGTRVAGKTYQITTKKKYHTPKSEWIRMPDNHPAIISKDIYDRVQEIMAGSRKKMSRREYLLYGKTTCGCCGFALSYTDHSLNYTYRCTHTHADPVAECHKMIVSAPELEEAVMSIIRKQAEVVLNSGDFSGFRKAASDDKRTNGVAVQSDYGELEKQINLLTKQRQHYYEQYINLEIDRDAFISLKTELNIQIDCLVNQVSAFKQMARKKDAANKVAALAKDALSTTAAPKDIVDALVEKVLVYPGFHLEIHWKFAHFAEKQ